MEQRASEVRNLKAATEGDYYRSGTQVFEEIEAQQIQKARVELRAGILDRDHAGQDYWQDDHSNAVVLGAKL
jgi:hypothetical protein